LVCCCWTGCCCIGETLGQWRRQRHLTVGNGERLQRFAEKLFSYGLCEL
jgi:hypothetical protein